MSACKLEIVDLTAPLDRRTPRPTGHPLSIEQIKHIERGSKSNVHIILMTSHVGTHIDAPLHVHAKGKSLDLLPLENLVGDGVVLRLHQEELGEITAHDLEDAKPKVRAGDILFINTGWFKRHKKEGEMRSLRSKQPGITQQAANWIVKKNIKLVGIDTLVIQHPKYDGLKIHQTLLHNDSNCAGIVECLANLEKVEGMRLKLGVFPLPITSCDGAPIRAVAFLEH